MARDPAVGPVPDSLLREVADFLYHEAEALDDGRFLEWLSMLSLDVHYRMPVRVTHTRAAGNEFSDSMAHFDETRDSLEMRIRRLGTGSAWAEDPPSRTRHFVSNIRVDPVDEATVAVRSNLLLYRNRGDSPGHDLLSAERRDRLRRNGESLVLTDRLILLDQATLGTLNLAVFL